RCNVITINQITSIAGKEPLATLATYKRKDNKVIFGQNCVANATDGLVKIGDELIVLKEKE
ncbi:MAG: MOSC domain-containing protein, partial [Chitinophagaceae bacterium]